MQGSFFWYDVMADDTAAAAKFYGDLLGWNAQAQAGGNDYHAFLLGDRGVAGLMPLPEDYKQMGGRPAWMGYIYVNDVDDMVARIEAEGGKLHKGPFTVPGVIRLAVVSDPQGAGFLIANPLPKDAPPPLPPGTPGTIGWHELYAADWEKVWPFYEKLFGWTKDMAVDMGPMGLYQTFKTGGDLSAGGMMTKPAQMPAPPHWGFYFNVPAIDAAAKKVADTGGQILNGPAEVPGPMYIVNCMDPQGAPFSLVGPKR